MASLTRAPGCCSWAYSSTRGHWQDSCPRSPRSRRQPLILRIVAGRLAASSASWEICPRSPSESYPFEQSVPKVRLRRAWCPVPFLQSLQGSVQSLTSMGQLSQVANPPPRRREAGNGQVSMPSTPLRIRSFNSRLHTMLLREGQSAVRCFYCCVYDPFFTRQMHPLKCMSLLPPSID